MAHMILGFAHTRRSREGRGVFLLMSIIAKTFGSCLSLAPAKNILENNNNIQVIVRMNCTALFISTVLPFGDGMGISC